MKSNNKFEEYKFWYKVTYHLGDFKENNYYHEEEFRDTDLRIARKKAFDYFKRRCEWANEQQGFFNNELKLHGAYGFKPGEHVAFEPSIYFMEQNKNGKIYEDTIVDGNISDVDDTVQEFRDFEADVLASLGYTAPEY